MLFSLSNLTVQSILQYADVDTLVVLSHFFRIEDYFTWINNPQYKKLWPEILTVIDSYYPPISIDRLDTDFIREFKKALGWYAISRYQTLSEPFIREFKDNVNWEDISEYQTLSESFIREFKDRVWWDGIFC